MVRALWSGKFQGEMQCALLGHYCQRSIIIAFNRQGKFASIGEVVIASAMIEQAMPKADLAQMRESLPLLLARGSADQLTIRRLRRLHTV